MNPFSPSNQSAPSFSVNPSRTTSLMGTANSPFSPSGRVKRTKFAKHSASIPRTKTTAAAAIHFLHPAVFADFLGFIS